MSFVPLTAAPELHVADPPRLTSVTFTDGRRSVPMPVRAALPVLARAHRRDDLHPRVALLSGAAMLGVRLVAEGRFEPGVDAAGDPCWRAAEPSAQERDRLEMLVVARTSAGDDTQEARRLVEAVVAAVVDAMPRQPPSPPTGRVGRPSAGRGGPAGPEPGGAGDTGPGFAERLEQRIARISGQRAADERPQLVTVSLRVEADEEELVGGAVRLVLQAHDERDPLHVCDAALLWTDTGPDAGHGFGERARTHATLALRGAAEAWPVLEAMLEQTVPDQITLDSVQIADLLEHGVGALAARGVDVLWPRSLGRDLTAVRVLDVRRRRGGDAEGGDPAVREGELQEGLLATDAVFGFDWRVSLHGEALTDDEMAALVAATGPLLRLRGSWVVVDPATARKARQRLLRAVPAAEAVAAALTGTVQVDDGEEPVVVGATLERLRDELHAAADRAPVPTPAGLRADLRDYQRHGLTWLADLTARGLGGCLADDMGLGKTVTLIALVLHRRETGLADGPTLVVCPTSLMGNWEAEVHRFAPDLRVRRFHGADRRAADPTTDADVVVTTYGTLRTSVDDLAAVGWDLVVADEAQHVKNPRSATARALRRVGSGVRVALTGTPVENELEELWAVLDWACPGLLGSRLAFRRRWAVPVETGLDPAVARRFADLVSPFLLRRRKTDPGVAPELPEKFETDHRLGLTREQTVLYEGFLRDTMERIERSEPDHRRGLVLSLLTGLKQICNHPAQFLAQSDPRTAGRSEKLDLLGELLTTVVAESGAALVFTQYVAMARLVSAHLARLDVDHHLFHGGTPVAERERLVADFQSGRVPVLLLSLKAGGTGLNLTRADHVVHVDRWWNPAVEDQATDRTHRIGRTRPVQVHRLVTEGTLEERIGLLLERKRGIAESVLARADEPLRPLTELDDAELRDLVALRPRRGPSESGGP